MKEAESISIRFNIPIQINLKGMDSHGIHLVNKEDSILGSNVVFMKIVRQYVVDKLLFEITGQYIMIKPKWLVTPLVKHELSFLFPFHNILQLEIEEKTY